MDRDDLMVDRPLPSNVEWFLQRVVQSDATRGFKAVSVPSLPSLLGIVFAQSGIRHGDMTWIFDPPLTGQSTEARLHELAVAFTRDEVFRRYAQTINHARPRKVSWRRLNRQQKDRAIELAKAGLL